MKKIFLFGILGFLGFPSLVFADDFTIANQQFKAGDFVSAAASYEKTLSADGPNAAVYYNLGNSYQQSKQYGPAILAYERARLLTPRDPDLLANLVLARKSATAFEELGMHPWLYAAISHFSRNEWSWLVAGAGLFLGGLGLFCGAVKLQRRVVVIASCVAGLALLAGGVALYLRRGEAARGVILSAGATVRLSPFEKAESLGTPGVGRVVQLGVKNGSFQYIEVPSTNLHGWVARQDVAAIAPSD